MHLTSNLYLCNVWIACFKTLDHVPKHKFQQTKLTFLNSTRALVFCLSVCLWSKLNFSLFTPLYTTVQHCFYMLCKQSSSQDLVVGLVFYSYVRGTWLQIFVPWLVTCWNLVFIITPPHSELHSEPLDIWWMLSLMVIQPRKEITFENLSLIAK